MIHPNTIYAIIRKVLLKNSPSIDHRIITTDTNLYTSYLRFSQAGIISLSVPLNDEFIYRGIDIKLSSVDLRNCKYVKDIYNVIVFKLFISKHPEFQFSDLLKNIKGKKNITFVGMGTFGIIKKPPKKRSKQKKQFKIMNVFYATNREYVPNTEIQYTYTDKRGNEDKLSYGNVQVSIPKKHIKGEIESPSIFKFQFSNDPNKHITLLKLSKLYKSRFFTQIKNRVDSSSKGASFIFIHGYNVSFEDAAKRTAQMAYDLNFDGPPVFFSWPSRNSVPKYTYDENNIEWSKSYIRNFLIDYIEKSSSKKIYLIAHSMGNRGFIDAYISLIKDYPKYKNKFTEIILAAPDIDASTFKDDISSIIKTRTPITLYASSKDKALKVSKAVHGGHPRAGDSGKNILIAKGVESIDCTDITTNFLGHSYYANNRSLLIDMYYIINHGLRADKRGGLTPCFKKNNDKYWKF